MIVSTISGFNYFDQTDPETKTVTKKVAVCFEDTQSIPQFGKLYSTYTFKAEKVPQLTKDSLGKEIIVELGNFNGRKYGSSIIFK